MPLLSLPADKAFKNLRRGRRVLWPDGRHGSKRLEGVATVEFEPSFKLDEGEAILTIGSCFARNIERRLTELGFDLPANGIATPADERASRSEGELLNKYGPHAILNELRWAFEPGAAFPESGYLRAGDRDAELWHDPHLAPSVAPASLERVRERRGMVTGFYRQLPRCGVVVLTMGMAETWFDEATGLYLNGTPPHACIKRDPRRFRLDVLSVSELVEAMEQLHALLAANGRPDLKVLITVSPVPFAATFTGQDAITANSYSKSALRAAVEEYVRGHSGVDYFPSYEIVTHTVRTQAFANDDRHVANKVVSAIVDRVVTAYFGVATPGGEIEQLEADAETAEADAGELDRARLALRAAVKAGHFGEAMKLFALLDQPGRLEEAGLDEFWFRYEYGRALLRKEMPVKAEMQLQRALELQPDSAAAHYAFALSKSQLQRYLQAEESFRTAAQLEPKNLIYLWRLAREMIRNKRHVEAEQLILLCLARHPGEERLVTLLAEARQAEAEEMSRLERGIGAGGFGAGVRSFFARRAKA